jgi:hypothetical protein
MPVLDSKSHCSRRHLNGTAHRCLFHKLGAEWLHSRPFFAPGVADVGETAKTLPFPHRAGSAKGEPIAYLWGISGGYNHGYKANREGISLPLGKDPGGPRHRPAHRSPGPGRQTKAPARKRGALARGRPARSRRHARRLDAAIGDDRCCASGSANDGHGVVIRRRGGPGVGEKLDKVAGKIRDGHQADEGHDGGNRRPAPSEILTDRKHLTNFPMSTLLRTAGRMVWLRYKHISGAGLLGYDRNSVAKRFDP